MLTTTPVSPGRPTHRFSLRRLMTRAWLPLLAVAVTLLGPAASSANYQSRLEASLRGANLGQTQVAFYALDLTARQTIAAINIDEPLIPASNMKLITTSAALALLGADFEFATELRLFTPDDPPADDHGSNGPENARLTQLVITGDGDPAFCGRERLAADGVTLDAVLNAWIERVKAANVERIDRLVVDDRVFAQELVHPDWPRDQLNRRYCPQVSGLNFHNNTLTVAVRPAERFNDTPWIDVYPLIDGVGQINRAVTGSTDTFWIGRKADTNQLTFYGKVKHPGSYEVTVHDPSMYFGRLLAERLRTAGVAVERVERPDEAERFEGGRLLARYTTPLIEIVQRCNRDSQNLFAESMFKRLGHRFTGAPGSWHNGAATVREFMRRQLGAAAAPMRFADGSGMSRANRVTARNLVNLLSRIHHDPEIAPVFLSSLAVGGRTGTLRSRFRDPRSRVSVEVYAKSGFLDGVTTLSGFLYIDTEPGAPDQPRIFLAGTPEPAPVNRVPDAGGGDDVNSDAPRPAPTQPAAIAEPASTSNTSTDQMAAATILQPDAIDDDGGVHIIAFSILFNNYRPPVYHHNLKALQDQLLEQIDELVRQTMAEQTAPGLVGVGAGGGLDQD